ncbi:hypothetical protein [Vibrio nitrifigilis]|uniref:Uncharacterized protein n=1 Tax=Vibrio nitrifigilis TaxID=2789781 RepID=A0ABS0GMV4_9VIBR|nr:hypothetical protein [Vibrio nitrifigilis]MBF9003503.1 hypothetical protein [Vibrio nitrifigilis]
MQQKELEALIQSLCEQGNLPNALSLLKQSDDAEIAEAAESLSGQFILAEVDGEQRIYHQTIETNDEGVEQEFVEYIMNEGDDVILFVAWFFDLFFSLKQKDVYQMAGKTYHQPKRR